MRIYLKCLITLLMFFLTYLPANSLSFISSMAATMVKPEQPVSSIRDVDFGPYMREMQRKIKSNWQPYELNSPATVVLKYQIKKNGELGEYGIVKSSGNLGLDNSAIDALKNSAPFRPLPVEFKENFIEVQFTFNYNTYKK